MNPIKQAVKVLGGFSKAGRIVGLSPRAVRKWAEAGRLPRTEATGETNYAELLANADPRISKEKLLSGVFKLSRNGKPEAARV